MKHDHSTVNFRSMYKIIKSNEKQVLIRKASKREEFHSTNQLNAVELVTKILQIYSNTYGSI